MSIRIGIVGYGKLGKYLVDVILKDGKEHGLELAFVWNRTSAALDELADQSLALSELDDFESRNATLIIEVAHPSITQQYAARFLSAADYYLGSPTALADAATESAVRAAVEQHKHRLFVPCGALWGAADIVKMARRKTLRGVKITMAKHPSSLKLRGEQLAKLEAAKSAKEAVVLYDGPLRALCPQAPNNVNTMACAALAGVGFDETRAVLISDVRLESHDITIEVRGPDNAVTGAPFQCNTQRINPAAVGAVTGQATYVSFFSSVLEATAFDRPSGIHIV